MATPMKGLNQFILDLHNAPDTATERKRINFELSHIQEKFAAGVNLYHKKKYVSKLLYIHLLGLTEETQFGTAQALELLASPEYPEKLLGYTAVAVLASHYAKASDWLYHERLLSDTHARLVDDLAANSDDTNALALQFIANSLGASHTRVLVHAPIEQPSPLADMLTSLAEPVYSLCVSPLSLPCIRKRACLALLTLLRIHPPIGHANDTWFPRLLALMDDPDLGVVLCAAPLAVHLTTMNPALAKAMVPSVASRLHALLVERLCPPEYMYHDVPAPWLAVKLLLYLEHVFLLCPDPSTPPLSVSALDPATGHKLRQIVGAAVKNASTSFSSHQNKNALSSILFQAVSIAPFLDAAPESITSAINALVLLLDSVETNMRYLVLDALVKLSARSMVSGPFDEHLDKIFDSLADRDISVRKKTLDLLFTCCNENNYTRITSRFLDFFSTAEPSLKNDISIKVALLAERFATESIWYISTMLRLLSLGGQSTKTNASDGKPAGEVWERIIQIIVNNPAVQKQATKYVINLLRKPQSGSSEHLVKVAAFAMGEYGHQIAGSEDAGSNFGPDSQFQILCACYFSASASARPMLMSALVKFVMHYPDQAFVPEILDLLEAETLSLDLEIQTRANEYLKLASMLVSGDESDAEFARVLLQPIPPFEKKHNMLESQLGNLSLVNGKSLSSLNVARVQSTRKWAESMASVLSEEADPFTDKKPKLSPNWKEGYYRMLQFDAGIFFEDHLVKITYRIKRDGPEIEVTFTIINNAAKLAEASLTAFTVHDVHNMSQGAAKYSVNLVKLPLLTIAQKDTLVLLARVREIMDNGECPVLAMSFKCSGSFNTLTLKIPIVMTKTLLATTMNSIEDFKNRWLQIGEAMGLETGEARAVIQASHKRSASTIVIMLQRLGFAIIQSTADSDALNVMVVGAGILRLVSLNYGVLVTVRGLPSAPNSFDLAVRSTGAGIAAVVHSLIRELFEW